jgi:hypothetical protein
MPQNCYLESKDYEDHPCRLLWILDRFPCVENFTNILTSLVSINHWSTFTNWFETNWKNISVWMKELSLIINNSKIQYFQSWTNYDWIYYITTSVSITFYSRNLLWSHYRLAAIFCMTSSGYINWNLISSWYFLQGIFIFRKIIFEIKGKHFNSFQ